MSDSNSVDTENVDKEALKVKFVEKISNLNKDKCSFHIRNKQMYEQIICEVELAKVAMKKTSLQYRRLKRYDVVCFGDEKKLIKPLSDKKNIQYYVTDDELFDVIEHAHQECGHGGRDLTIKALNKKYANVTKECVNYYLDLCETCHKKKNHPKKGLVIKPLLFKEIQARGQVDLIDMQTCPDRDYKYILNYQDHLTKFLILRPLHTKTAQEVAHILLDIFCTLGAPSVLQSDNGREFANRVVEELKVMWPELSIVHGKPRHSQSQGSIERANQHIQQILFAWMDDNKTNRWSEGLRFCQLQKNCAYHHGIQQSPFEVMFGRKAHVGIQTLPDSIKKVLQTEEELENAINSSGEKQNNTDDTTQRYEMGIPGTSSSTVKEDTSIGEKTKDYHIDKALGPLSLGEEENSSTLEITSSDVVCCICQKESSGAHTCIICNLAVHVVCADSTLGADYEGFGSKVTCMRCAQTENIKINKEKAIEGLHAQATVMKKLTKQKFPPIPIGKTITIPIPSFDRAKGDARNVLGIIQDKTVDGLYRVGTKHGTINTLFSRNQIKECKENFLNFEDVPDVKLSLREISTKDSKFGGQGFIKCHCNKKCSSKLCKCKRSNVLCNSKCHNASPCENKD